jgi:hypothetical protein
MGGIIYLVVHFTRFARHMDANHREMAGMARDIALMVRRQYADIDRDLQEMKEMLGGLGHGKLLKSPTRKRRNP